MLISTLFRVIRVNAVPSPCVLVCCLLTNIGANRDDCVRQAEVVLGETVSR